MDDKKQLFEKQLNYITSNFETDLQRLIKTRSYISISENVINEEIESLKKLSDEFEAKLKNLVMQTLDIEGELSPGSSSLSSRDENFKSLKRNLNDYISMTESFISNLESRGKECTGRLESLRSYYLMELEASRDELDSRINSLQSSFSDVLDGKNVDLQNYHERISGIKDDIDNNNVNGGFKKPENPVENTGDEKESEEINQPYDGSASQLIDKANIQKGRSGKWKGALIIIALLLASLFLFLFLTGDKGGQKLAEDSYRQSKTVNKENRAATGESESSKAAGSPLDGSKPEIINETGSLEQKPELPQKTKKTPQNIDNENVKNKSEPNYFSVEGPGAYVREGPGTGYDVVTTVVKGSRFEALGESRGQWMKIKAADGEVGWISSKLVNKADAPQKKISATSSGFTLKASAANLRTGPGTGYEVITVVKEGVTFKDTGETSRHWKKVKLENGTEGWISGKLIKKYIP